MQVLTDSFYRLLPAETLVTSFLSKLEGRHLTIEGPDGNVRHFGDENEKALMIKVKNNNFWRRVLTKADIGLGESYMEDEFECEDLVEMFRVLVSNHRRGVVIGETNPVIASLMSGASGLFHWLKRNTPTLSHHNVHVHYDLGNDFYELMLDKRTMGYTCGIFDSPDCTLEQAQLNKFRLVMNKAELKPTDRVAELGCGWGGFAIEAAQRVGCHVTAVNLSGEQISYAREKAQRLGVDHLTEFCQMDYRAVEGEACYDKVVSIGMMEHVGHFDLPNFFATADRLLKPNGILVIHMITFIDQRYQQYVLDNDFIKEYVFPGCCIPSNTALMNAATNKSRFVLQHMENFGANYAKTLHEWNRNFTANLDQVRELGYDEKFIRMWKFYLEYCEAAFEQNYLGLTHMVFTRPTVDDPYPLGRRTYTMK